LEKADMLDVVPTFDDVLKAHGRLLSVCRRTPIMRSDKLDALIGGNAFIKPEVLQVTGSFKFRGAYNRLLLYAHEHLAKYPDWQPFMYAQHAHDHDHEHDHDHVVPKPGVPQPAVVAFSSGNHAQGVAAAAKLLGIQATIVMPSDAPALKVKRTRDDGADIVFYDRATESREDIAAKLAAEKNAIVVPSFDDPHIIAGQGTAAIELIEDICNLNLVPDIFLCCCGGGGLAAGCGIVFTELWPAADIVIVEPENYDDVTRSLDAGEIVSINGFAPTMCDALQTPKMAELTFAILSAIKAQGVVVSETEIKAAMRFAFEEFKLVVEPGGAVALAAALSGRLDLKGRTVAIMLSGGNVDAATFAACIA
jgi:threonine dehydratase